MNSDDSLKGGRDLSSASQARALVLSTVKYLSMRKPLLFYGLPGILSILVALFFFVWTLQIFGETRALSTNVALIAVGATMVGLMLMTTAIILWVTISVIREKS